MSYAPPQPNVYYTQGFPDPNLHHLRPPYLAPVMQLYQQSQMQYPPQRQFNQSEAMPYQQPHHATAVSNQTDIEPKEKKGHGCCYECWYKSAALAGGGHGWVGVTLAADYAKRLRTVFSRLPRERCLHEMRMLSKCRCNSECSFVIVEEEQVARKERGRRSSP